MPDARRWIFDLQLWRLHQNAFVVPLRQQAEVDAAEPAFRTRLDDFVRSDGLRELSSFQDWKRILRRREKSAHALHPATAALLDVAASLLLLPPHRYRHDPHLHSQLHGHPDRHRLLLRRSLRRTHLRSVRRMDDLHDSSVPANMECESSDESSGESGPRCAAMIRKLKHHHRT